MYSKAITDASFISLTIYCIFKMLCPFHIALTSQSTTGKDCNNELLQESHNIFLTIMQPKSFRGKLTKFRLQK